MINEKIQRINELAAKSKTVEGLTPEEKEEQQRLRAEYIAEWKKGLEETLDNTYVLDHNGKHKLQKKGN